MKIGFDKQGEELKVKDICRFKINGEVKIGFIIYDEESYAYAFEMVDNSFPMVLICRTDFDYGITKITSIYELNYSELQESCKLARLMYTE